MQLNPYSIPIILGIGFLSFLMRLVAQRNRGRVVTAFMSFSTTVLLHSLFFSAQLLAANANLQTLFFYLMVFSTMLIPLTVLFFIVEYLGYDTWLNWRSISVLLFFPVLAGILQLTDPLHGLFWEQIRVISHGQFTYVKETSGLIPLLITIYLYFILGLSMAMMFWGVFHIPTQRRKELNILIVALSIPMILDLARTFNLNPWPYLYITPYGVLASVILLGVSIIRYDFLNAIPAAYNRLFSDVTDVILVFDHKYNLLDLNFAAKQLFFRNKKLTKLSIKGLPEVVQEAIFQDRKEFILPGQNALRYFDIKRSEISGKDGFLRSLVITLHDISLLKENELQLQKLIQDKETLLAEKEVLLREVNHRVKNNFNLAGSLLFLEAQKFQDRAVKDAFEVSRDRLRTMSLLNERLYRSDNFNNLDLGSYLCSLAEDLISVQSPRDIQVKLDCHAEVVSVSAREAIPSGLILNELVTNSLKYAFTSKSERSPTISLRLSSGGDGLIKLQVDDNGCGYPKDFIHEEHETLGLRLVHMLGQDQLGGTVNIGSDQGAYFNLLFFPEPEEG